MKPWRSFWKRLDQLMAEFVREAESPPFNPDDLDVWISSLKFNELIVGDSACVALCNHLVWKEHEPLKIFADIYGQQVLWQLMTRCECALDFCRGRVGKRKEFNWKQDPKEIYIWLLVDFWRGNALHWASKTGRSRLARIGFMHPFWKCLKNPTLN